MSRIDQKTRLQKNLNLLFLITTTIAASKEEDDDALNNLTLAEDIKEQKYLYRSVVSKFN
jgi:hypothetical protein